MATSWSAKPLATYFPLIFRQTPPPILEGEIDNTSCVLIGWTAVAFETVQSKGRTTRLRITGRKNPMQTRCFEWDNKGETVLWSARATFIKCLHTCFRNSEWRRPYCHQWWIITTTKRSWTAWTRTMTGVSEGETRKKVSYSQLSI